MNATEQYITDYARQRNVFRTGELFNSLSERIAISKKALSWYLNKLVRAKQIFRIGHGVYTVQVKQVFNPKPNISVIGLYKELTGQFPLLTICAYNGEILAPLQHHISSNNNIYIETERDAVETVFHFLQDSHERVFLSPNKDMVSDYIHLDGHSIIVKPLITESPLHKTDGVNMPTLEKLLVDIQCDDDFFYLQGAETEYVMDNAFDLYEVNVGMLLRYAGRRNFKTQISEYLKSRDNFLSKKIQ